MNAGQPTENRSPAVAESLPPRWGPERINDPEIVPFEVWDLVVDGSTWAERFYEPGFSSSLRKGIESLRAGHGQTRSKGPVPPSVAGFEAVFLAGGRAKEDQAREGLARIPPAVVFAEDVVFGGAAGGFAWLEARGLSGWVLDLGQSQLKLAAPGRRWIFQRDSTRLRATGEVPSSDIPAQRRRLREFIALKLQLAMSETRHRPQGLVAALPCRVTADATPLGGNYAGLRGYRELLPDVLHLAGLSDVPAFVLNDAELAALSARANPQLARFRKILVLTLGFGIGAALVCRPDISACR